MALSNKTTTKVIKLTRRKKDIEVLQIVEKLRKSYYNS